MTKTELHITLILSMIFALRMSGIFMILPVLTIHAISLHGANTRLIGMAIGIYGLVQILFQLPFGLISDKIGRKPVIIGGLILFAIGSEIAALTNSIWGIIIGRALQGSGAISSVLLTLLLESVQEKNRTKAMALVGTSFGVTFTISMICGPAITNSIGLHGLFHSITLLNILAIIFTYLAITPITSYRVKENNENWYHIFHTIKQILTHLRLIQLNTIVFCIHTILMLNFIVLPKIIINLGFSLNTHWKIYGIIMLLSAIVILLYVIFIQKKYNIKKTLTICIQILFISELFMLIGIHSCKIFLCGMQLFFIAFNLVETILPTLINKESPKKYKGTAISIYSIGQLLGVGLGGILGGCLFEIQGIWIVLLFALIISALLCITVNYTLRYIKSN